MASTGDGTRSTSISSHTTAAEPPREDVGEKRLPVEKVPTTANLSKFRSIAVAAAIVATQFVQQIPFGAGINGAPSWARDLGVPQGSAIWLVAGYPLTQGAFVLMGGRLGAVYGHKNLLMLAAVWWVIFSIVNGFMRSLIGFAIMRALTGIGGAFMVPNAIALLTTSFPPGRMRNITVGFFGAMTPIGAAGGTVLPGFFGQLTPMKWLFFFLAILGAVIFTAFYFIVPNDDRMDRGGKIDYFGAALGVSGLMLFNFAWTQAPAAGWNTPYIYSILLISILLFGAFTIWEWKFTASPILPLDIWTAPSFSMMLGCALLNFMGVGISIWYISLININIRGYTSLSGGAAWATLAVGGAIGATLSARAIPLMAAQYIMVIGSVCTSVCIILVMTQPEQQIYWAQMFPALVFLSLGPDFLITATQIIASNTVRRSQQGIAGSLIGTILPFGLSTGLGFGGTVESYTNDSGKSVMQGYRHALYLALGMTLLSTVLALLFVRIPKDERQGWAQDDVPHGSREASREASD